MELDLSNPSFPVFHALSSKSRIEILRYIGQKECNIQEIATHLHISSAMVSKHVKILEEANLVSSVLLPGKSGLQKLVSLKVDNINISFPEKIFHQYKQTSTRLKIGHFINFNVEPTCGLATKESVVGKVDEPKYFMDINRVESSLLWFSQGFVEYKIPNPLKKKNRITMLEISLEISSEFPGSNNIWPSDISFYVNNYPIGIYTVPGNFSDIRGRYTPLWWNDNFSQYGQLKHIRISDMDTGIDGQFMSKSTLSDLKITESDFISLKIAVLSTSKNIGGLTLFGESFGNFPQDILINTYYE